MCINVTSLYDVENQVMIMYELSNHSMLANVEEREGGLD